MIFCAFPVKAPSTSRNCFHEKKNKSKIEKDKTYPGFRLCQTRQKACNRDSTLKDMNTRRKGVLIAFTPSTIVLITLQDLTHGKKQSTHHISSNILI